MAPKRRKASLRPKIPAAIRSDNLLPTCEGPKLGRFEQSHAATRFIKLLSAETPGVDGHVFEVVIKSKHYALKLVRDTFTPNICYTKADRGFPARQFRFFDTPTDADGLAEIGVSNETFIGHCDPFYAECRAYGCIENAKLNGHVAIRCYGFMAISAKQESKLAEPPFYIDISEWNRPEQEYDWPTSARQPFRAIVKELVKSKNRLIGVAQMREDLFTLHGIGVFVEDIQENNFINGKLIDFSRSRTRPHIMLDPDIRSQNLIGQEIEGESLTFDRMVERAGLWNRTAASADSKGGRLRSNIKKPSRYGF